MIHFFRKFYVTSGKMQETLLASDAEEAACHCTTDFYVNNENGNGLAPLIAVSERGFSYFEHEFGEDLIFDTKDILRKCGLLK